MTQKILDTERLRLVPLAEEHLEFEVELDSDPEVMRCLAGRASSRAEVEQAYQRRLAAARGVPGLGFWAGFTDGDFVGWWILQPPNGPDQPKIAGEAGLGYRLLRRHWRRGYASEGARALIWRAGKHTSAELAELFSVARSTAYRAVQRAGELKKTVRTHGA
jgi:RimJ/RimL family protein N-acetyltransferase